MKRQLWKALFPSLGAVVGLVVASSVQAQVERELFLKSYPNADITVDGDASDWDLSQFGTFVVGGVNIDTDHSEWERVTGTGDIARLGWENQNENLYYAGMWTGAGLPEDQADHSVKIYARDNATHQYFLVDITDDEINTGDGDAWANDSVEFYIDPENDGDPTDWSFDVQLVIDADNQVQVWNSPIDYEEQVEAGVTSAITITDTGWLVEVEIDKAVFDTPLPAILGPENDPEGRNYGIDFMFRDNDDPEDLGDRGGDSLYTSAYTWADPFSGGGFPSKAAGSWGSMIAGSESATPLQAGDADQNLQFDQLDLVAVQIAAKYLTGATATWGEGDWNGAPGGEQGNPPLGDGQFNQLDVIAALGPGHYLTGPYGALAGPEGTGDGNATLVYDATTGEVTVDGSLAGGGSLGAADLRYVPEPSTAVLLGLGMVGVLLIQRRRQS